MSEKLRYMNVSVCEWQYFPNQFIVAVSPWFQYQFNPKPLKTRGYQLFNTHWFKVFGTKNEADWEMFFLIEIGVSPMPKTFWVQDYQKVFENTPFYVVGDGEFEWCYCGNKEIAETIAESLNKTEQ